MRILIIGGGAAGGTAAQFARKTDRKADITMIDAEPYGQYSRCGLPYALRGDTTPEKLVEFGPEWFEKNGIEALYGLRVRNVDFSNKVVETEGKGQIEYDRLIIATGARPWKPPIEGMENEGVFFLRTLDDLNAVREWVGGRKKVIVVGAGLIGLESAESFVRLGMDVTVVEFLSYPLPTMIDEDMGREVKKILDRNGIKGYYSHEVIEMRGNPVRSTLIRNRENDSEIELEADIVVVSTGNSPNTEIFEGIEKGRKGHIRVNSRSETSYKDVFAAGDCTEYPDFVTGKHVPMGMGTMAVRQGMAAGTNAAGGSLEVRPFIGTRTTELFGVEIAGAGPTAHILKENNIDFVAGRFRGKDLPDYMDGRDISVRVLASREGRILGAQIMGRDASWRISMFAEAIMRGDTVQNLSMLETPYAPPIAPTVDPTSIACTMVSMRLRRRK